MNKTVKLVKDSIEVILKEDAHPPGGEHLGWKKSVKYLALHVMDLQDKMMQSTRYNYLCEK